MGRPPTKPPPPPPTLFDLSLECVASRADKLSLHDVSVLPEEVASNLFDRIMAKGKLTPRVVQLFEDAEQEAVIERISAIGINTWTLPVIKDDLGDYLYRKWT